MFNIIENLALFFIFLYELIGKTAQPIVSAFFAECNYGELHRICRYCLGYSLLLGTLVMAGVMAYPQFLDLLFGMTDGKFISDEHAVKVDYPFGEQADKLYLNYKAIAEWLSRQ